MLKVIKIILLVILPLSAQSQENFKYSVGAGYGMEFGGAGFKLDYTLFENIHIVAGLGLAPSTGFIYFLRDRDVRWRPKISLHYGVVGVAQAKNFPGYNNGDNSYESDEIKDETKFFYGPLVSIGQKINIGNNGRNSIDVSFSIPITDGGKKKWQRRHDADDGYNNINLDWGIIFFEPMPYINIGYGFHF